MRAGVGLLGCRLLHRRRRQQPQSDLDRTLGRDLVDHRQLAQHQRYAVQLALWRDVRVDAGLLGRRLLL